MSSVHEEWRLVVGLEGKYEVSNLGRVRSWQRPTRPPLTIPRIMNLPIAGTGYHQIRLPIDGRLRSRLVHRLVAEAFIPNPDDLPVVRHLNHIRTDNRVENLAWGTYGDNLRDSMEDGRFPVGEAVYCAKLTEEQVLSIRADPRNNTALGAEYGVDPSVVSAIRKRQTWSHLPVRQDDLGVDYRAPYRSKLTAAEVLAIRADTRVGVVVAAEYGVSQSTVSAIRLRRTWAHLP